jgi:sulfite reductase (NADPH) flavoprotein alpha-component
MAFPLQRMAALQGVPVDSFRKLSFPHEGDAQDVFTPPTDAGTGLIDQGTGELLSWSDLTP